MNDLARKIGVLIRKRRIECDISQEDLASDASVDRSYMGRIERGKVNISISILYEIARALDCEARDLLPAMSESSDSPTD
ncbi:helix-turn-helix domain-containing protein [Teredinibacter purpureus]|uniref:helix-turn-helix domain-containing protein n=1 Tax=Teredinibacter purpureus TaxID=2731756 RepID=UPI0005F869AB|nr:helix-turn-helix transcriptional regulator [Teredinibacter purpureus]